MVAPGGMATAVMLCAIAAGAATQRITGLGFALVAAPLLVLAAGPREGVLLANALSLATNIFVLAQTWRDVEPARVLLLVVPALLAMLPGLWVVRSVPPAPLMVGIGLVVLVALLVVMLLRDVRLFRGKPGAVIAGALSGFMNITAGVGGPAITLYAAGSGWGHRAFVASMQLYFASINTASVLIKGVPVLGTGLWAAVLAALALGLAIGYRAAPYVSAMTARRAALGLALVGAGATVIKGLLLG